MEYAKIAFIILGLTAFIGSGIAWYIGWNCPKCPEHEDDTYGTGEFQGTMAKDIE